MKNPKDFEIFSLFSETMELFSPYRQSSFSGKFFRGCSVMPEVSARILKKGGMKKEFLNFHTVIFKMHNMNKMFYPQVSGSQHGDLDAAKELNLVIQEAISKQEKRFEE